MAETGQHPDPVEARVLEVVEGDFVDYCGHIFEWDPAWDETAGELHCPECLERAGLLASRIAAALEDRAPMGPAGRFVPRRIETVMAMRVQEPYLEVRAWCDGIVMPGPDGQVLGISFRATAGGASWFAEPGDWIVRAEDGSFRGMGAAQFEAEYTPRVMTAPARHQHDHQGEV